MVEGGGQTPVLPPDELKAIGFTMVAYPTTILSVSRAPSRNRSPTSKPASRWTQDAVDFKGFKDITGFNEWARIEDTYKQTSSSSN